jgi:hypothetical protein
MKNFIILALAFAWTQAFSQIVFEPGYLINNDGEKLECFIRNVDWANNPTAFEYKTDNDASIQKASIDNVREFGINGVSRYVRATVNMDKSSNEAGKLSTEINPVFHEETIFLKVLVEGEASLFVYTNANLTRFFYQTNESPIAPLVYKSFVISNKIGHNNTFRQQILTGLSCEQISRKQVENLNYQKSDLEKVFATYNACTNSEYIVYDIKKTRRDNLNLSLRPGLNFSNLSIMHSMDQSAGIILITDFGNEFTFRFGAEAEVILPFNKGKWSFIVEPTYQYFTSEKTTLTHSVMGGSLTTKINYHSIELPIGVRHYIFLGNQSKISADISYVFDFTNNNREIQYTRIDGSLYRALTLGSGKNFGLGLGYTIRDKYSIGMKYQTSREILGKYYYFRSSYNTITMILGYRLY